MPFLLLLVLLAVPAALAAQDSVPTFDGPTTQALVERVVRTGSEVPPELHDYRAEFSTGVYLALRADSAIGGEFPITVDEFAGDLHWARGGLLQTVRGHRVRLLVPTPYTIGSALADPWIIPHLYGSTIDVWNLASNPNRAGDRRRTRALQPFSPEGLAFYSYRAGDTVRISSGGRSITLVPIEVRPRRDPPAGMHLVTGRFDVDTARAAVARARFGFVAGSRLGLQETGVFFDLENSLWRDRFWLPRLQRREVQIASPLFGGAAAARLVTRFRALELNTGWEPPPGPEERLVRLDAPGDSAFRGWPPAGAETADWDIADFADLRREMERGQSTKGVEVAVHYSRADHLFRYNRVEGAYLGAGALLRPRAPDARWELYGTAGWAFSEATPRGEIEARLLPARPEGWALEATAYRRLRDLQPFRPAWEWDWIYTLPAALGGYDVRDYLSATGTEAFAATRRGPWTLRAGGRVERQDSVRRNTDRYLFGEAENFPPVGAVEPGTHAAVEGELRYVRGSGAYGIGPSTVASLRAEAGVGDFRVERLGGLLSTRRSLGPVTLALRADAGHLFGSAPPQMLFRFGDAEGLAGALPNQYAGSTAALGRARLLLFLPPYGSKPLARSGFFLIPPLRPALVVSGQGGWTRISDASAPALARLGALTTDGARTAYGVGVSVFDDALTAEWTWPGGGGGSEFYIGLVRWF